MSEENDDLKSIKVYKFNNTKESWHEFDHKFRVIADTRGYYGVIDGTMSPPDEQEIITIAAENKEMYWMQRRRNLRLEQPTRWVIGTL